MCQNGGEIIFTYLRACPQLILCMSYSEYVYNSDLEIYLDTN
jgi:hypothetical protein